MSNDCKKGPQKMKPQINLNEFLKIKSHRNKQKVFLNYYLENNKEFKN